MKKVFLTMVMAIFFIAANANNLSNNPSLEQSSSEITTTFNVAVNPFCKAIMQGKTELVKQMIQLGEDVNKKCLGKTPAMYAARYNKPEILKLLIKNGADLSIKSDKESYTAKKFAELSNATEALDIINKTKQV